MNHRTIPLAVVVLLAAAGLGTGSVAFAAPSYLEADVPFDFVVRDRVLPAGTYAVRVTDRGVTQLRGAHGAAATVFTIAKGENHSLTEGRLVFAISGETRRLIEVWHPGDGRGREILPAFRVRTYENTDRLAVALRPADHGKNG